jgi:hypothetical protein
MTVANRSDNDLPWLNVHVFPSNTFQLEPVEDVSERLMAGQYAIYRFRMLDKDGKLEKWAKKFGNQKREELSVRIFKKNSIGDAVLIDFELGGELFDRIKKYERITSQHQSEPP